MALSVIFDGTTLFEGLSGESADWSGTDGVSTEVYQQGTSAEGWIVAKNGDETAIYDYYSANGNAAADMSASDTHLYIHMRCDVAPFIDYLWIGVSSTSAGTTNYEDWQIVDNTTTVEWYGEWKTFIVDLNAAADRSNGTLTLSDVRSVRINVDNSNSGNIRSIENTYLDVGRFGTGITAYESTTAAFDLADIEAIADNGTNKFGVIENIGGVNFLRGRLTIGDSAGTNYANFTSSDETAVFLDSSVSGEQISTGLYQLNFVGNSTNPTAISIGTKVGTGDDATGRNGTAFSGETTAVAVSVSTDANVTWDTYGLTFRQLGGLVTLDDLDTGDELAGCTFDGCDQVDVGAAVVRNCSFLNSTSGATSGAFLWNDGDTDIQNSLFVNNSNAVQIVSLTDDITLTGMSWSGNTYDLRYEGTTDWDANYDGTAPTVNDTSTGTLTPVSSKTATFTPIENGSAFTITKNSDNSVLEDVASTTGGEVVYTYDGTLDGTATTVHLIIVGKEPIDFLWTIAEGTVPVSQVTDRIYSNP